MKDKKILNLSNSIRNTIANTSITTRNNNIIQIKINCILLIINNNKSSNNLNINLRITIRIPIIVIKMYL